MGENTKIPWADHTFNAWIGCTHVAPECDFCYAELMSKFRGWAKWGSGEPRKRTSVDNWKNPDRWNREAERLGIRYRVFCSSLSDVFDTEVPPEWRDELFAVIARTPELDWLLLTKRPAQMRDYLNSLPGAPWPNIWALVSAGTQKTADAFIPILLETNAVVRGVSGEPMLEAVDYSPYLFALEWLIVGSEGGPKARPADHDWYRKNRDDCQKYNVAFFLKQYAERGHKIETPELDGRQWMEFPTPYMGLRAREFPEVRA